jgi:peroxiredoxin
MNKNSILAIACCLPLGLMAQTGYTLRGKIGRVDAPAIAYLEYSNAGKKVKDSVVMQKGSFLFTGHLSNPVQASVTLKHDTAALSKKVRPDALYFWLENSAVTITAADSVTHGVVKGSLANEEDRELTALQRPYRKTADSVVKAYYAGTEEERKDSAFRKALGTAQQQSQQGYDSVTRRFIIAHPNSYIALQAFAYLEVGYNFNPDTATRRFSRFAPALQTTALGKKITGMIETGQKTRAGVMAMDFTQPDSTGKPVKLSDYRGHYVLVDFWASWCKPCRAENPNMLAAWKKYKDKNFDILGVSLDEDKGRRAWLHAVAQDGLPWTQVSDLKGFESPAAVMYGVKAIPSNFLIDPSGKIVGTNLRGEELEKKLAVLLK